MSCDPVATWADPCSIGTRSSCEVPGIVNYQAWCVTHERHARDCVTQLCADRDEILRKYRHLQDLHDKLRVELDEAIATSDGLMVSINMMESHAAGLRARNRELLVALAEANARVAELVTAVSSSRGCWSDCGRCYATLNPALAKAEAAKEPRDA